MDSKPHSQLPLKEKRKEEGMLLRRFHKEMVRDKTLKELLAWRNKFIVPWMPNHKYGFCCTFLQYLPPRPLWYPVPPEGGGGGWFLKYGGCPGPGGGGGFPGGMPYPKPPGGPGGGGPPTKPGGSPDVGGGGRGPPPPADAGGGNPGGGYA